MTARWNPTRALLVTGATAGLLAWFAVALHRVDLVVLAAPLAAALLLAGGRRPTRAVRAELGASSSTPTEGQELALQVTLDVPPEADSVTVRVVPGTRLDPSAATVRVVRPAPDAVLAIPARAARWGRTDTGSFAVSVCAADGFLRWDAIGRGRPVKILPSYERFTATEAAPNARGTVGTHHSRRLGEGMELRGVRPFVSGDRLRRVNWPVSLRTGELHVTATLSERDTSLLLVLDPTVDVSPGPGQDTSLDVAVHAAAAVAEHYLRNGDRVGLVDTTRPTRPLRPASGRAQLDRVIDLLLDATPQPGTLMGRRVAPVVRQIAPRATVLLLSPLLGAADPRRAAELAAAGSTVLVVDTLPADLPAAGSWAQRAWRLTLLERRSAIERLGELGVPVVSWRGGGSLDEVLTSMARASVAPRSR